MKGMKLSELALSRRGATAVLRRFGLDYCCGGEADLVEACTAAGCCADEVLAAVEALPEQVDADERTVDWRNRSLDELIDYILTRYHEPLPNLMADLVTRAERVERVHAGRPAVPAGLADELRQLGADLILHLAKEERILFPLIRRGARTELWEPAAGLRREHDDAGRALRRIRALTADLTTPPGACPTWRSLYSDLHNLEADLMDHIHLENAVLFPRALAR